MSTTTVMDEKGAIVQCARELVRAKCLNSDQWLLSLAIMSGYFSSAARTSERKRFALTAPAPSAVGPHVGAGRNPHYEGTFEDETDAQAAQRRASAPAPSAAEPVADRRLSPIMRKEDFDLSAFSEALIRSANARGKSMKDIAFETGVSETTLSRMRNEGRAPDAASLAALGSWAGINPGKCHNGAHVQPFAAPPAPQPTEAETSVVTEHDREMDQALAERDEREEVINAILDEVLGLDRHEWSSAYGFADAIEDVKTRMHTLSVRSDAFEAEAAKFQAETLRASKLHAMLTRWVERHQREHDADWPGAKRCDVCTLVGESKALLAAPPAPQPNEARPSLLAADHTSMRVDYSGLLKQARAALRSSPGLAEMLRQLQEHLEELGQRWYAGDTDVVDELLQLYCIEREARQAMKERAHA